MSGDRSTDGEDKGSWEAALEEYTETWLREFGVGFHTFDTPDSKRIAEPPSGNKSVDLARTSFRSLMTFVRRKRISWRPNPVKAGEPGTASVWFQPANAEEQSRANELLGAILLKFVYTDEKYFAEILRLKKAFDAKGTIQDLPMKCALFIVARDLAESLQVDPTKQEVLDAFYNRTKHRPLDPYDLFREAKLGFLKAKRGRPPKNTPDR